MKIEVTLDDWNGEYTEILTITNNCVGHKEICEELDDFYGCWLAYNIL